MTLFFLVVGLEAKRELDKGELRERRRITIPAIAAAGGMALPVAIYLVFNAGGPGTHGWGAAMSTDTAFALGVLALLAPGGTRLRVALLTFAVVDDLAALLVIATVYTDHVEVVPLLVALGLFGVLLALRFAPLDSRRQAALLVGIGIWVALLKSGVDPVITGLAVGLVTTAYPPGKGRSGAGHRAPASSFREQPTPELARSTRLGVDSAVSANDRLQYRLHPWTSFVIVPIFALANVGVHLDGDLLQRRRDLPDHPRNSRGVRGGQAGGHPHGGLDRLSLDEDKAGGDLAGAGRGEHGDGYRLRRVSSWWRASRSAAGSSTRRSWGCWPRRCSRRRPAPWRSA